MLVIVVHRHHSSIGLLFCFCPLESPVATSGIMRSSLYRRAIHVCPSSRAFHSVSDAHDVFKIGNYLPPLWSKYRQYQWAVCFGSFLNNPNQHLNSVLIVKCAVVLFRWSLTLGGSIISTGAIISLKLYFYIYT